MRLFLQQFSCLVQDIFSKVISSLLDRFSRIASITLSCIIQQISPRTRLFNGFYLWKKYPESMRKVFSSIGISNIYIGISDRNKLRLKITFQAFQFWLDLFLPFFMESQTKFMMFNSVIQSHNQTSDYLIFNLQRLRWRATLQSIIKQQMGGACCSAQPEDIIPYGTTIRQSEKEKQENNKKQPDFQKVQVKTVQPKQFIDHNHQPQISPKQLQPSKVQIQPTIIHPPTNIQKVKGNHSEAIYQQFQHQQPPKDTPPQFNSLLISKKSKSQIFQYQKLIQQSINQVPENIDGLGQHLLSLGYYEWNISQHYIQGIKQGKYSGTSYDFLSLYYESLLNQVQDQEIQKGIKWYQNMVDESPDNYAVTFGYANILSNRKRYQQALNYYQRVSQMKPEWTKPLQCIAEIYQYEKNDHQKSQLIANQLLQINRNNRVALLIKARNQKNIKQKIQQFKKITQMHTYFGRGFRQLATLYRETQKKNEAIQTYQNILKKWPQYKQCYFQLANYQFKLNRHENAIKNYTKAIQLDKNYKEAYQQVVKIFKKQKYDDDKIKDVCVKTNIKEQQFYFNIGLAYRQNKQYDKSQSCFQIVLNNFSQIKPDKIYYQMGKNFQKNKNINKAIQYYKKSIDENSNFYEPCSSLAQIYKRQKDFKKAQQWFKKALEINPSLTDVYIELVDVYKRLKDRQNMIPLLKKVIELEPDHTIALTHLGMCFLRNKNYREAFNMLERAKQCSLDQNNSFSESEKRFLKTNLHKLDSLGKFWRQNGHISAEEIAKLKGLISSFDESFESNYDDKDNNPVDPEIILKKQIVDIALLIEEDKFKLKNIEEIYYNLKNAFISNEDYFHILPLLFMHYFYLNTLQNRKPILDIQQELKQIVRKLSDITASSLPIENFENNNAIKYSDLTLPKKKRIRFKSRLNLQKGNKVNLFKEAKYFQTYEEIYNQIMSVNERTKHSFDDFKCLVDRVRKQSYGELFGLGMKIPSNQKKQFKVILRIFEKMFKKQLNEQRVKKIILNIDKKLNQIQNTKFNQTLQISEVARIAMDAWTEQISEIVKARQQQKIQTKCQITDLLRAKIMYNTIDHIRIAMSIIDDICDDERFDILEIDNRLVKKETQDVVFKIKIKDAVCELQLAIKQNDSQYHWTHSIYEIERSPLGCIFGSYIFMSKGFEYPFLDNCRDMIKLLKDSKEEQDKRIVMAAKYIVDSLTIKKNECSK